MQDDFIIKYKRNNEERVRTLNLTVGIGNVDNWHNIALMVTTDLPTQIHEILSIEKKWQEECFYCKKMFVPKTKPCNTCNDCIKTSESIEKGLQQSKEGKISEVQL